MNFLFAGAKLVQTEHKSKIFFAFVEVPPNLHEVKICAS